jgi:L-ascorbate metabolism protein UlaG (beta-lactamase superfamily)
MDLRKAKQKDEALLQDIERARQEPEALHAWWLGQSGFLLQYQGRHVLFDPYLSDSLTRKYAGSDKEHVRMTERVIAPERLDFIDLVTSSHNHTDHLDRETLEPLLAANPGASFVVPRANREFAAERLEIDPESILGLTDGESVEVAGTRLHGIAAAHDERAFDEAGRDQFMGFILEWGPWTIYHSGDTRLYPGLTERLGRFEIDLAFLPINGFKPERRVAGNLNAAEAVNLARETGLKTVVPHHYHMFTFNTVEPDEFERLAGDAGVDARVLENGERLSLTL